MVVDDPYFGPAAVREAKEEVDPSITDEHIEAAVDVFWSTHAFNVDSEAFWEALGRCQATVLDIAAEMAKEDAEDWD
jgi:hypothetical protein